MITTVAAPRATPRVESVLSNQWRTSARSTSLSDWLGVCGSSTILRCGCSPVARPPTLVPMRQPPAVVSNLVFWFWSSRSWTWGQRAWYQGESTRSRTRRLSRVASAWS